MKTDNGGQQALVPAGELIEHAPEWFIQAIETAAEERQVAYEQTHLNYRKWTGPSADAANIVMVHGGGAHARLSLHGVEPGVVRAHVARLRRRSSQRG